MSVRKIARELSQTPFDAESTFHSPALAIQAFYLRRLGERLLSEIAKERKDIREWTNEIDRIICGIDCMSSSDIDAVRLYLDKINGDEGENQ